MARSGRTRRVTQTKEQLAREAEMLRARVAEYERRLADQERREVEFRQAKKELAEEQARRELERQRLRTVLAMLPVGVFIADAEGRVLEANAAARAIWGQEVPLAVMVDDYAVYKGWWPETGRLVAANEWPLAGAIRRGEARIAEEIAVEAADGQRRTILDSAVPLRDETGAIIGAINVNVDITDRKRAEEIIHRLNADLEGRIAARTSELEEANRLKDVYLARERAARAEADTAHSFLATVLDQTPAVIAVLEGPAHICRYINPFGARIFAQSGIRLEGRPVEAGLPDLREQGYLDRLDQVYRTGEAVNLPASHYRFHDPAGHSTDTWWDFVFVPWRDPETEVDGVMALGQEISDRVRAESERDRLTQQKDDFLSIASHELKTPLTSLKGRAQHARRRLERAESPEVVHLQWMEKAIARMERLVNDIVDIARIESGMLALRVAACDLVDLCRQAADEQATATGRAITVNLPATPTVAAIDADRVSQVIANLLSNALKYSPDDHPVTLALVARPADLEARISVRDEGAGIPAEALPHIFERFYRVPGIEVRSGTGVGLGLGLYICHEIVERHHGRIWAESVVGGGSAFYVALPMGDQPA
jgi:PAS domain S-box-containing protein